MNGSGPQAQPPTRDRRDDNLDEEFSHFFYGARTPGGDWDNHWHGRQASAAVAFAVKDCDGPAYRAAFFDRGGTKPEVRAWSHRSSGGRHTTRTGTSRCSVGVAPGASPLGGDGALDPDLAECLKLYGDEEGWHRQRLTEFLAWIGGDVRPMGPTTRTFYRLLAD